MTQKPEYEIVDDGSDPLLEAFKDAAYSYRAWPGHDVPGVAARYRELLNAVGAMVRSERMKTKESE